MNEHAKKENLTRFGLMALRHWEEHLPRMYKSLKEAGTLIQSAYEAQERTKDLVVRLHDKGMRRHNGIQMHEAVELALAEWILIPAESDQE